MAENIFKAGIRINVHLILLPKREEVCIYRVPRSTDRRRHTRCMLFLLPACRRLAARCCRCRKRCRLFSSAQCAARQLLQGMLVAAALNRCPSFSPAALRCRLRLDGRRMNTENNRDRAAGTSARACRLPKAQRVKQAANITDMMRCCACV